MITDIVLSTKNRLPLLTRTLDHIFERTTSPYRLHVIDDASTDGNVEYLKRLRADGRLARLILHRQSKEMGANWNEAAKIAQSKILVYTEDDVLCPKLSPDWLARGLRAMAKYPRMGMLALNAPTRRQSLRDRKRIGPITICNKVGYTFTFIRLAQMKQIIIPRSGKKLEGIVLGKRGNHMISACARAMRARGFEVGYLTNVYCQHIGAISERKGIDLSVRLIEPLDADTLQPPLGWRKK